MLEVLIIVPQICCNLYLGREEVHY